MRQYQSDISRVFALPERFPANVGIVVEDFGKVPRARKLGKALPIEQLGAGRCQKWSMRRCRDVRHLLENLQVVGVAAKLVVANERAKRVSAEHAVPLVVDLFEHS